MRILLFACACTLLGVPKNVGSFLPPTGGIQRASFADDSMVLHDSVNDHESNDGKQGIDEIRRKTLLSIGMATAATTAGVEPANAERKQASTFLVTTKNSTSAQSLRKEPVDVETPALSSELCLIRLLPIKNPVFRALAAYVESISSLRTANADEKAWRKARKQMQNALSTLDSKRAKLEPIFNQEDSTILQIAKSERGERAIGSLRDEIDGLVTATKQMDKEATLRRQKNALLALADIGELLVASFPYDVPTEGKFSYLPRLLGRCRVTFGFKRDNEMIGNVTIVADGFAAPITAGNFVDLCARQFYTGLPVKAVRKTLGGSSLLSQLPGMGAIEERLLGIEGQDAKPDEESVVPLGSSVTVPILGSFQEGFYDPLTAKPRRLPLELVRVDKGEDTSKLSYSSDFSDLSSEASIGPSKSNQPLLSFDIPGLVAMNHPDNNVNGASSEFFSLQKNAMASRDIFEGSYAPFGYIIDGYDLYQDLRAGDVIASTVVGEWGQLNLVKIRGTSFIDAIQSDDEE